MLVQDENETRINYLMRVLEYFMDSTIAGQITVCYDDAICDGMCLAEDIRNAVDELEGDI